MLSKNIPDTFVGSVLFRPKMYTLDGTFEEVISFLNGYYSGLAKCRVGMLSDDDWTPFRYWLVEKLDCDSEPFVKLRQMCSRAEEKLDTLKKHYIEFKIAFPG